MSQISDIATCSFEANTQYSQTGISVFQLFVKRLNCGDSCRKEATGGASAVGRALELWPPSKRRGVSGTNALCDGVGDEVSANAEATEKAAPITRDTITKANAKEGWYQFFSFFSVFLFSPR